MLLRRIYNIVFSSISVPEPPEDITFPEMNITNSQFLIRFKNQKHFVTWVANISDSEGHSTLYNATYNENSITVSNNIAPASTYNVQVRTEVPLQHSEWITFSVDTSEFHKLSYKFKCFS